MFEQIEKLEPGLELQAQEEDGSMRFFMIKEVGEKEVVIDSNHPLAGMALNFEVAIEDVREATSEELEHGHVHSPGHDHH
jgi:FKBP-type peptidyl-prolyl cis-trans isomerase SlyD